VIAADFSTASPSETRLFSVRARRTIICYVLMLLAIPQERERERGREEISRIFVSKSSNEYSLISVISLLMSLIKSGGRIDRDLVLIYR